MVVTHNLGFPRIGAKRELKFAQEAYWNGKNNQDTLLAEGVRLRQKNWQHQAKLEYTPVGDFSFYDQVLDTSLLLGNLPDRTTNSTSNEIDNYFRAARGRSAKDIDCDSIRAGEMTKWFDTNYHYIVPEVTKDTVFTLNANTLLSQLGEAKSLNIRAKPVIIGPITYLWLSKEKDDSNKLDLLDCLLPIYKQLLIELSAQGAQWVQIDEPVLATELDITWQQAFEKAYDCLGSIPTKILMTTYFGELRDNLPLVCSLPVAGLHVDAINAKSEIDKILNHLSADKVLSLGVIDGRNIWKTDLNATLDWLEPIAEKIRNRLWLAPSCSLLHVPVDVENEHQLDPEIKHWLAFALQKISELSLLAKALNHGRESVVKDLNLNAEAIASRRNSNRVHNAKVKKAVSSITPEFEQRNSVYSERVLSQRTQLNLPIYPTTTIGSFPQTENIRKVRRAFKKGNLDLASYTVQMKYEIEHAISEQEALGLDVLVHGEAERNDMVEYFGEQLEGYAFSQFGWVQSYGSRCVKPPVLFGDISRPKAMTLDWIQYAQSLTQKPVKGMLTGPVTMLNWSFVRDDQPRKESCFQLALAIREEVLSLEQAGINIIQVDEAALREGLPLRHSEWSEYLGWAIESFRIAANGVRDETQIHTHMCYSKFNDIIEAITNMDADVITIENSRSNMELLAVLNNFEYPNEIGPGVYDIHSPNIPSEQHIIELMKKASERVSPERLWVNPDCGLKTRQWKEVLPALKNMVSAAQTLRKEAPV